VKRKKSTSFNPPGGITPIFGLFYPGPTHAPVKELNFFKPQYNFDIEEILKNRKIEKIGDT